MAGPFTTRQIGEFLGVEEWRVRRPFEDGRIPEPPKFGGKRMITADVVPAIVDELRRRGWLHTEPTEPTP